jgi:hypothetical protein
LLYDFQQSSVFIFAHLPEVARPHDRGENVR